MTDTKDSRVITDLFGTKVKDLRGNRERGLDGERGEDHTSITRHAKPDAYNTQRQFRCLDDTALQFLTFLSLHQSSDQRTRKGRSEKYILYISY